jgi:CheY-like chemotaxis protein
VEVADNGPGIAPADLPLVWDPFWTTKRGGEGTGLGLAVVHEIVSRLGGEADVESEPGAGAQFRITLPAVEPPAAVDDAADGESLAESARQPLDVLVVDADREAAAFVTRLLSSRGHAVVATHGADDALALVTQGADVVLLTATLAADANGSSNGDARPLLDRLRAAAGAGAPRMVVVTDGDAAPPPLADGDVVVAKPFDVEQLRRSVEGE